MLDDDTGDSYVTGYKSKAIGKNSYGCLLDHILMETIGYENKTISRNASGRKVVRRDYQPGGLRNALITACLVAGMSHHNVMSLSQQQEIGTVEQYYVLDNQKRQHIEAHKKLTGFLSSAPPPVQTHGAVSNNMNNNIVSMLHTMNNNMNTMNNLLSQASTATQFPQSPSQLAENLTSTQPTQSVAISNSQQSLSATAHFSSQQSLLKALPSLDKDFSEQTIVKSIHMCQPR